MPRSEIDFPGHNSLIRREARARQRSFYRKQRQRVPKQEGNLRQEDWPKADPDKYYTVNGGQTIVKGSEFAEGILPMHAKETELPLVKREEQKFPLIRSIKKKLFG